MDNECYRFKLGAFTCFAISDGYHTYSPPDFPPAEVLLFANKPGTFPALLQSKHNIPVPWTEWKSPYICLLIDTGKQLILVDTGAGGLAPTTGKIVKNLQSMKIKPGDIDIVINTHGHPDHLGGNTDANGKPTFPGARYFISRNEWDFWTGDEAERKLEGHSREILVNTARKNLLPLKKKFDLIESDSEIVPGIKTLAAPGHTPGLIVLSISSQDSRLLCISDTVLHPIHLEKPEWFSVFDILPGALIESRHRFLKLAEDTKPLVMAFHFPFPGLGLVKHEGVGWMWEAK